MTAEDLVNLGLYRWKPTASSSNAMGVIECPFVLFWLLAAWSQNKTLAHFNLASYTELQNDPELPMGLRCWQNWEEFTVMHRIIKSQLFGGKSIPISKLHAGAMLGTDKTLLVQVNPLKKFVRASHQYDTKSNSGGFSGRNYY